MISAPKADYAKKTAEAVFFSLIFSDPTLVNAGRKSSGSIKVLR